MPIHGHVHPEFADVARAFRRILPRREPGGAALAVYHGGEKVVDVWGGSRGDGHDWAEDTLSISFSTTKGLASTLLHVYADRGLVDYDAPVARYWPEFAQAGKEAVTVRQVLSHEAGLYAIVDMVEHASEMLDWEAMTARLAAATPRHAPGRAHGYHALTYGWLVGEIARRVAGGKDFAELVADEVAGPLGLDGLYCGVPPDELHRCAPLRAAAMAGRRPGAGDAARRLTDRAARLQRWLRALGVRYDPRETLAALVPPGMDDIDWNGEAFRRASIPAANGMFTARSLARMYACLAAGGGLDGVRLVSPETVRAAATMQNRGVGRVIPISMRWRLGYHRVFTTRGRAPKAFGHFGFGGSGAWADPTRNLAVALTVNSGVGTPFGDTRIARVGSAALRAADRRS